MQLNAPSYGISQRIDELITNLDEMNGALNNGVTEVDLNAHFISPLSILPLVVYANNSGITINYTNETNNDVRNYLSTIGFPTGVTSFSKINKQYLPITNLSTKEGSGLLGEYEERLLSQFGLQTVVLKHLTHELVSNVAEHSQKQDYWLFAQAYKSPRKTVEIVLADCGIGYKQSYQGTKRAVATDKEAITNALEGLSSKTELAGRGFGIPSIVKLFVGALNGKIVILSGNSLVYYKKDKRVEKTLNAYWQGSVVGISFFPKDVDFYNCIGN